MRLPWKIGGKSLTSGADSGIIKMGKAKKQVLAQTPADFSKYTISGDIESVQVAKNSLIFLLNPSTTDTCIVMAVDYLKKAGIT